MSTWMIGKKLMKQHHVKKNFIATEIGKKFTDVDYMRKEFVKTLK